MVLNVIYSKFISVVKTESVWNSCPMKCMSVPKISSLIGNAAEKPDDYFYIADSSTQISRVHDIERAAIVSLSQVMYGNFGELT